MIAGYEDPEHEDSGHQPVQDVKQRNQPTGNAQLTGQNPVNVEDDAEDSSAADHRRQSKELGLQAHLNSLPKNPFDFSWEFVSR